jgi:hypothetical protein
MRDQGRNRFYGQRKDRPTSTPSGNARGVPAENALDTDNDVFDEREHQFEEAFRIGFDVLVDKDLPI